MSRESAGGSVRWNGGNPVTELSVSLVGASVTLTSQASAAGFFNSSNFNIYQIDTSGFEQCKLTARVGTTSASVNNPRLTLLYAAAGGITFANYVNLGDTEVAASMFTGQIVSSSGWINLAAANRFEGGFLALGMVGGDASASPVVANVMAHLR